MAKQLTLKQAIDLHKQASEKQVRKQTLLKAAAQYIAARESKNVEFKKKASTTLAAVVTQIALEKAAGTIPPQFLKAKKGKGKGKAAPVAPAPAAPAPTEKNEEPGEKKSAARS